MIGKAYTGVNATRSLIKWVFRVVFAVIAFQANSSLDVTVLVYTEKGHKLQRVHQLIQTK